MGEHTPGPWIVINHGWSETSVLAADRIVCGLSIEGTATEENQQQLEAQMARDAHLIAAAPNLLEVLKRVTRKFGVADNGEPLDWTEWQDCRAAIAKAESHAA